MNESTFTVKGIKRETRTLLTDNWTRAMAIVCISLFALMTVMLANQFATALIERILHIEQDYNIAANDLSAYIENLRENNASLIVSAIIAVFYFLLVSPLNLGCVKWYQSLSKGDSIQVGQIFTYYRDNIRFIKAIMFELRRILLHVFYALLSMIPAIVCVVYSYSAYKSDNASLARMLAIAALAFLIAGIIVYVLLVLRFFLAKYLYVGGYGYGIGNCFQTSTRYMRGNAGRVLALIFSFAGWFVLSLLIFPLAVTIPYFGASMADCAQNIIDENLSRN
ncbi:MAG: DUF975 family protein [Clostridia bacterium]|nr:DUF975 family protein [Clostridia bacterium]MBQ9994608.1 DUF975 family protein [Clostridia bacterium]